MNLDKESDNNRIT